MLLDDMLTYLSSGGIGTAGTDLFAGMMPPGPVADAVTVVYETPGRGTAHAMGNVAGKAKAAYASVQVVCRGAQEDYVTPRALAQKAFLLLDGLPARTINGVRYLWGQAENAEPFLMGFDESRRPLIAFNAEIIKELSSTS